MIVASAEPAGPRVCEPLKMTSDISLPRRLLALCEPEDPLDRIDDVRLSGPVGADDDGDPVGKVEASPIGKTLETGQFECF